MRLTVASAGGGKARTVLYVLASALAVLLILLAVAQTQGTTPVALRRAGQSSSADGDLTAALARLTAQLEELKGLTASQLEAAKEERQGLRSELAALQQAQQSSSQAIAAELASLASALPGAEQGSASRPSSHGGAAKADAQLQATFEGIYADRAWGTEGNGSGSGSAPERTVRTRQILLKTINDLKVRSMIDVPCGAMAWMPLVLEELEQNQPGFHYLGLDIARPVVEANKAAFRNHTNWKFDVKDMTSEPLPKGYDLIHCRDALQHLSCPMIVNALHNFVLSEATYLLVGSYDAASNINIPAGSYFDINLRLPPFSLSNPEAVLSESTPNEINKLQLLYRVSDIAKQDFDAMRRGCDIL